MPLRIDCVDNWLPALSKFNRRNLTANHTLYPYFAISYSKQLRTEIDTVLNGGISILNINHMISFKIGHSKVKYMRYCPLCVSDDIDIYGETYWHRQHQLSEVIYCNKHFVLLVNSSVSLRKTSFRFYPASNVLSTKDSNKNNVTDTLSACKDKLLKIGQECEWLITHGLNVDWSTNGATKYHLLLRNKGLTSSHDFCDYKALNAAFYEYWGKDFLDSLFIATGNSIFNGWVRRIENEIARYFTPLKHILLACFLSGSLENFVRPIPPE
jgi:hypothetical protein